MDAEENDVERRARQADEGRVPLRGTVAIFGLGVTLAVLVSQGSDALGLPTLARSLLAGAVSGTTIVLVAARLRRGRWLRDLTRRG